jgi:hypothetical protein
LRAKAGEDAVEVGVAVGEGALDLAADEEAVGEIAERAEGEFVVDDVGDEGADETGAVDGAEEVAMLPAGEGAAELAVSKVAVPGEVDDLSLP